MKSPLYGIILALLLAGCGTPQPTKSRPGATLEGPDLPPVIRGNIAAADSPPRPIKMQNAVYPDELKKSKIRGEVLVEFIVNKSGKVIEAHVIRSPHPAMERAAIEAIRQSEFEPGIRDGKPTAAKLRVAIKFDIENQEPNQSPQPPRPTGG